MGIWIQVKSQVKAQLAKLGEEKKKLFESTQDSYYNCWVSLGVFWILSKAPYDCKR